MMIMSNLEFNCEHLVNILKNKLTTEKCVEEKNLVEKTVREVYSTLNENLDHELAVSGNLQYKGKQLSYLKCAQKKDKQSAFFQTDLLKRPNSTVKPLFIPF